MPYYDVNNKIIIVQQWYTVSTGTSLQLVLLQITLRQCIILPLPEKRRTSILYFQLMNFMSVNVEVSIYGMMFHYLLLFSALGFSLSSVTGYKSTLNMRRGSRKKSTWRNINRQNRQSVKQCKEGNLNF